MKLQKPRKPRSCRLGDTAFCLRVPIRDNPSRRARHPVPGRLDGAGWPKNHLPVAPEIIQSMTQIECKKESTFQEYRILDEY